MTKKTKIILAVACVAVLAAAALLIFLPRGAKSDNKLIFATEGNWAPWTYYEEDGKRAGFDIEVARAVAGKLGMEAEFMDVEWSAIFAGIDSGRYTTAANGVDITEDRSAKYDFSVPYAYNSTALIVRSDNEEIKTFEDLSGKTTVNSPNSTYMTLAEQYGANVIPIESLADTMKMVIDERAVATLNAVDSFNDYMKAQPTAPLKIAALHPDKTSVAFPFPKGKSAELLEKINKAIEELRADGTLTAISMKYFGYDITNP